MSAECSFVELLGPKYITGDHFEKWPPVETLETIVTIYSNV
jgi:hypothetical protein